MSADDGSHEIGSFTGPRWGHAFDSDGQFAFETNRVMDFERWYIVLHGRRNDSLTLGWWTWWGGQFDGVEVSNGG
jgi:hypothetical protein